VLSLRHFGRVLFIPWRVGAGYRHGAGRVAERAGRSFATEWALTSERVPAATMMQRGVVNRVVPDAELEKTAREFAVRVAKGPTRAYAAHKALLSSKTVLFRRRTIFDRVNFHQSPP